MDPFASNDLIFAYALLQAVVLLLLVRFLDLYEREPLWVVAVMFVWGAIGAAILASLGNEALQAALSPRVKVVYGAAISAPIVEEIAKGLALLVALAASWWAHRRFDVLEFDGVTDGIVFGAAIGIGFAFTEDLYYFFREAQATGDLGAGLEVFLDRRDFHGPAMLRHAIWTATFGAALGLATWARSKSARVVVPLLGLALAMLMHAVNNGLLPVLLAFEYGFDTTYRYLAVGVPTELADRMDSSAASIESTLRLISWIYVALFLAAIATWLAYQRRVIRQELAEERESGLISAQEEHLAPRFFRRAAHNLRLLRREGPEEMRASSHRFGEIVDLALAKRRQAIRGGGEARVRRRRERLLKSP